MATNVRGYEQIRAKFDNIRDVLAIAEVRRQAGNVLLRRTKERFDREVEPSGKAWKPLATSTLRRRRYEGTGTHILNRSGALRAAIALISGGEGTIYANTGAGVRIGIDDEEIIGRATAHQKGIGAPMRRFLGVGRGDTQAINILLAKLGREALRG